MNIGNTIKKLRRQHGVTQETLGAYLGLTAQAVSRWESGACCPDIQMLPMLAGFFDITTDELLGVDKTKSTDAIKSYLESGESLLELGEYAEAETMLRKALEQYPNSVELKLLLGSVLVSRDDTSGAYEACEICRFILKNPKCSEQQKGEARRILCMAYTYRLHDEENTRSVIEEMTDWNYSRELFTAKYLTGKVAHSQMKDNLKWLVDNVWSIMMGFCALEEGYVSEQYSLEEKIRIGEKSLALMELVFDGNYMYYCTRVCASYMLLARLYIMNGEEHKAPECIERASEYAMEYDARPDKGSYNCVLLKDVPYIKHQWRENRSHTESYYIIRQLEEDIFEGVRDERILNKLKRTVEKYEKDIL